ncbi:MAG: iron-containing alcohol dehydrogenase [Gudongella sp.]|jgi:1,3-propanediol dehydrogenase|nr:iron-containing alcohol dehydrogenase [Gudongella sp.]
MANVFAIPHFIVAGEDALEMSKEYLTTLGKKALIVTDDMMVKLGNIEKVTKVLDEIGIGYEIYSGVNSEPDHLMVEASIEVYNSKDCDFLIGVGGGSPMDAMKATAAVIANGGNIKEYMGKKLEKELPPMVTIPTTAGTGSEATKVSIINNLDTGTKMLISDPKLMAKLAIVDPVFTVSAPKGVTAATGVDALTHAVEAYASRKAFSLTDNYALSAVKRIYNNLQEVYENGSNIKARNEMSLAALEAGIAFSNASVTIVHGMSRPIGALFHVPHGLSNAMLLEVCLDFIKEGAVERFAELARTIGVFEHGMTEEQGADAFVAAVKELLSKLDIMTPAEYGIDKDEFFKQIPKMSDDALASGSPQNTRHSPTKEELMDLYKALW